MINSRQKGARNERAAAKLFREEGFKDVIRGQQFCGLDGNADITNTPGLHVEVKAVEKLNLYNAVDQSKRDARENEKSIVLHKKNNCEWLVTMTWSDWIELYKSWVLDRKDE